MDTRSLPAFVNLWFREAVSSAGSTPAFARAQQDEPALAGVALADLPSRVREPEDASAAAGLLEAVVRQYQLGDRSLWGPVLLEMLAPAIASLATEVADLYPTGEEDDFCRQVILETLHVAARTSTVHSPRWIKLRIVRRTRRRVVSWLRRDRRAAGMLPLADRMPVVVVAHGRRRLEARIRLIASRTGGSPESVCRKMEEERARRCEQREQKRLGRAA